MSGERVDVLAYDSAYPGSMSPRLDGSYIRRDDAGSLAAALLETIASLKREIEDLHGALDQRNAAVAGLIDKVDSYLTFGHSDTAMRELRAALSRIQPDGQG